MPCYKPLNAWQSPHTGRLQFQIPLRLDSAWKSLQVPCGKCIGCRLERSRQWAARILHEKEMHTDSYFLTLTYRPEDLPPDGNLQLRDFQLFMKRLRKKYPDETIRFYMCGEYGENFSRPHYHVCLFGHAIEDLQYYKRENKFNLYLSADMEKIWEKGFCVIGDVTFESAAYCARYITKKISGEKAEAHYKGKTPEFSTMSRRPGIGSAWFEKYGDDVYPDDFVVVNGKRCKPPKYYDKLLEKTERKFDEIGHLHMIDVIKLDREERGKNSPDTTDERLKVRETIAEMRFGLLKRGYEND